MNHKILQQNSNNLKHVLTRNKGHYHFKCHSNTTICLSRKISPFHKDRKSLQIDKDFNLFLWQTLIEQENLSCHQDIYKVYKEQLCGGTYTCFFFGSKDGDNIWTATSFFRATTCTTKWQLNEDHNSELSTLGNAQLGREEGLVN